MLVDCKNPENICEQTNIRKQLNPETQNPKMRLQIWRNPQFRTQVIMQTAKQVILKQSHKKQKSNGRTRTEKDVYSNPKGEECTSEEYWRTPCDYQTNSCNLDQSIYLRIRLFISFPSIIKCRKPKYIDSIFVARKFEDLQRVDCSYQAIPLIFCAFTAFSLSRNEQNLLGLGYIYWNILRVKLGPVYW